MLVDPQDPQHEESALAEKLNKFVQVHRNCFVLLYAPFNGPKEMETMSLIQHRYTGLLGRMVRVYGAQPVQAQQLNIKIYNYSFYVGSLGATCGFYLCETTLTLSKEC